MHQPYRLRDAAIARFEGDSMPTNSLVTCPACGGRREFLGIRKGLPGAEIRSFRCMPCDVRSEYEKRGRAVQDVTQRA